MPSLRSRLDRLARRHTAHPFGWVWGTPPHRLADDDGQVRSCWYDPTWHTIGEVDERFVDDGFEDTSVMAG